MMHRRMSANGRRSPSHKRHCQVACLILILLGVRIVAAGEPLNGPKFGVSGTFSIVAVDPQTGVCGAAVASKYPAVGRVVPYVRADVGAFCTQHWHHPPWGERALDLLASGHGPHETLSLLIKQDPRRDKRQLAIIDMAGRAAHRNPSNADRSGWYWGAMSGRNYSCQGNTLTGRAVVVAMAAAYEDTRGSLADRLMAALVAADCVGGDHRGRLAAGIRVAKRGIDGYWLELQVDKSDDAVRDLLKQYVELKHNAKGSWPQGRPPFQLPCPKRRQPRAPKPIHPSPPPNSDAAPGAAAKGDR